MCFSVLPLSKEKKFVVVGKDGSGRTAIFNRLIYGEFLTEYDNSLDNNWQKNFELADTPGFTEWYQSWLERLDRQEDSKASSHQLMRDSNPAVIPRNHQVEAALSAAVEEGNYHVLKKLLHVLADPYAHTDEQSEFTRPPVKTETPYRTYCGT